MHSMFAEEKMLRLTSISVLICLAVSACDSATNKAAAEANAVADIVEVTQFAAMFPDSKHFISYYTGTRGDSRWNSKAGVHGRYIIEMQFGIDFDPSRTKPKRISPPIFHLREISRIVVKSDGQFDADYSANQIKFGLDEWNRLRESNGDLTVLGIKAITNQPHKHFDEVWPSS